MEYTLVNMADEYDDVLLLAAAACCTHILRKRKRESVTSAVIANRDDQGDYWHLMIQELRSDPALFQNYFRLSVDQFDDLLSQIERNIRLTSNMKFAILNEIVVYSA